MTPERIEEVRKILSGMNQSSQLFPITVGDLNSLLAALEEAEQRVAEEKKWRYVEHEVAAVYHRELIEAQQTIARQREHIKGIHRIIISAYSYKTQEDLRSVLTSAEWACAEALGEGAKESSSPVCPHCGSQHTIDHPTRIDIRLCVPCDKTYTVFGEGEQP